MGSNKSPDKKLLRTFSPLNELTPPQLGELAGKTAIEVVPAGRLIFKRGQRDNHSVFIVSGEVALLRDNQVVGTVSGGSEDARRPLAPGRPRPVSARAKTKVRLFRLDADLLEVLTSDERGDYEVAEINGDDDTDWLSRFLGSGAFARLPAMAIQRMITTMEAIEVGAGDVVVREGSKPDYFYVVKSGRAVVTRRGGAESPEVKLAELGEGESFGEEALISGGLRNATVTMLSAGTLMRLAKTDFDEIIKEPLIARVEYEEARRLARQGATWLDVRAAGEHRKGALEGSVNVPIHQLRSALGQLHGDKCYLLYGADEGGAASAAFILSQAGFDARVLAGGLAAVPAEALVQGRHAAVKNAASAGGAEVVPIDARRRGAPDPEEIKRHAVEEARRKAAEEAQRILADARAEAEHIKSEAAEREEREEAAKAELERELASLREELEAQRQQARRARTEAEQAIGAARRSAEEQVKNAGAERERLRESLERTQAHAEALAKQLEAAEGDRREKESALEHAQTEHAQLERQLADAHQASEAKQQALQAQLEELKSERRTTRKQDHARREGLEQELAAVKSGLDEERRQREELEHLKAQLADEKARAEEAMQQANARMAELRAEAQAMQEQVEREAAEYQADEAERKAAEEEAKRKAAEEEAERKAAEEEAKRKAAEEEAERKAAEEEAERKAAEQASSPDTLEDGYFSAIDPDRLSRLVIEDGPGERTAPDAGLEQQSFEINVPGEAEPSDEESLEISLPGDERPEPPVLESAEPPPERRARRKSPGASPAPTAPLTPNPFGGALREPRATPVAEPRRTGAGRLGAHALPGRGRRWLARSLAAAVVLAAGATVLSVEPLRERVVGWLDAGVEQVRRLGLGIEKGFGPAPGEDMVPPPPIPVEPGRRFRDELSAGGQGPEMVTLPGSRFTMGAAADLPYEAEQPPHRVLVGDFAISRAEVTFADYDRFARATDRRLPDDKGWGRGDRPVVNVSWEDAVAYTRWLSTQTGALYRLPTEAEWEYAARAGTRSFFWWGSTLGRNRANCLNCGTRWDGRTTAPVARLAANAFGLHNTAGNVREWVQDCYRAGYGGASPSGGECSARVVRGGDFTSPGAGLRTSRRGGEAPQARLATVGFRVARGR